METQLFFKNSQEKKKAIGLIHRVYLCQLKNSKKYLAYTKTKSEVRGGGKKPWRQKGTGRARAGSIRSPLWVGGGVIFGPKPRFVYKKINKKEKQLAILSAFLLKEKQFLLIKENEFLLEKIETKKVLQILSQFNLNKEKNILFILTQPNKFFWLSARNLRNVEITTAACVNINQLLKAKNIILSKDSIEIIKERYGKE